MSGLVEDCDEESDPEERFGRLADLPPSAKLVYKVLELEGPLTHAGLVEETRLAGRTVRYATTQLEEDHLVQTTFYIPDARQSLYHSRPVTRPD